MKITFVTAAAMTFPQILRKNFYPRTNAVFAIILEEALPSPKAQRIAMNAHHILWFAASVAAPMKLLAKAAVPGSNMIYAADVL